MSLICNFTNDSDCSSLFDQVPVPFTAIQATLGIIILLTSVSINLLLIAAMVIYRKELDMSIIVSISVLISNIIVSVFYTGSTVVTSIARSWVFGFYGCKISSFIVSCGLTSRWTTVGLVSFDRFCRVFWPYVYQRHEKKITITLLIVSWAIAIIQSTALWLSNAYVFSVAVPGCLFAPALSGSVLELAVSNLALAVSPILGLILPGILYTIMYCKARKLRKKNRIAPVMAENPDMASEKEAQRRANRATVTYVLMIAAFVAVNVFVFTNAISRAILQKFDVPISSVILVGLLCSILIRSYVLGDVMIILTNKQQRDALKKLLRKVFKKKLSK